MTVQPWLVIGDLHLDVKAPSGRRKDNYEEACFAKLNQIHTIAVESGSSHILFTGDWFHRKNPAQVPHRLVRRTLDWLDGCQEWGITILTVAGNHDVWYGDTSEDNLRTHPFGILQTAPNFINVAASPQFMTGVGRNILVTGSSYRKPYILAGGAVKEDMGQYDTLSHHDGLKVHIVHGNTYHTAPNWEPYTLMADAAAVSAADVIHCGHIHDDLGIYSFKNRLGKNCLVTNIGSLTRGALNNDSRTRNPAVIEMRYDSELNETSWKVHKLKVKASSEIYALEEVDAEKEESSQISKWTDTLRSQLAEEDPEEDIEETIKKSSLDHRSRELALAIFNECE